jgi:ubiquitin C-terminal hydrolase
LLEGVNSSYNTFELIVGTNTYDLLGVIFHCGATPENGHYTTMVRSARAGSENGNAWRQTNDQHIAILSDELISKIVSGDAIAEDITPYVLM